MNCFAKETYNKTWNETTKYVTKKYKELRMNETNVSYLNEYHLSVNIFQI